jgi:hypothetical protein
MKLNFIKRILGCVLALALLASAADKAGAGVVIGGQLYTPLTINLSVTYYTSSGKLKKTTITAKDILNVQGYKGDQLARGPGGDIYLLNKTTIVTDLTASGYLTASLDVLLYSETSHSQGGIVLLNSAFNYTESGILNLNFYSNPQFDEGGGLDQAASRAASHYWFEAEGAYSRSGKVSATKNNQQSVTENFNSRLDGNGFDIDIDTINPLPVAATVSGGGSGLVLVSQ